MTRPRCPKPRDVARIVRAVSVHQQYSSSNRTPDARAHSIPYGFPPLRWMWRTPCAAHTEAVSSRGSMESAAMISQESLSSLTAGTRTGRSFFSASASRYAGRTTENSQGIHSSPIASTSGWCVSTPRACQPSRKCLGPARKSPPSDSIRGSLESKRLAAHLLSSGQDVEGLWV